ncbi:HAD family hydrolase [Streptomyces sparsogenes]|uniref:Aminosugar-converting enzyme n=1 Tax=Streptomyces sparsogenes DSM 40356 TaxID=1331668 RepID=A0A1R1SG40_9ACTN|nr:HAD family hydrolase [Streptomyces sparsogenes]OMI36989.1 aminosugar-converting enzyme [Streptomyces sparsogenes DSM 40356]
MIRTLFVDAGGVLFNNINEETEFLARVADRHAVDRADLAWRAMAAARVYESGRKHVHQVFHRLVGGHSWSGRGILDTWWLDHTYMDCVRAYHDNARVLRELREELPDLTLALTNNEAEHWDRLKDEVYGHLSMFDVLCSSWRVHRVKPARAFFEEALSRCRTTADETLLVDDRLPVLRAGAALGLRTLHISTPDVLADRLRSLVHGHAEPTGVL